MDLPNGTPAPWIREHALEYDFSPDGGSVVQLAQDGVLRTSALDGSRVRVVPGGPEAADTAVRWAQDGRSLFVRHLEGARAKVFRRDLERGSREPWMEIAPSDAAGIYSFDVLLGADGQRYVYSYLRGLTSVQVVTGLR